jgi:hypothetical protein
MADASGICAAKEAAELSTSSLHENVGVHYLAAILPEPLCSGWVDGALQAPRGF